MEVDRGATMTSAGEEPHPQKVKLLFLSAMCAELNTFDILNLLKKRYRAELAILDYIEMIECEVMALRQQGKGEP